MKKIILTTIIFTALIFPLQVSAASLDFVLAPSGLKNGQNCASKVTIMANATGQSSNSADIEISYNPSDITIIDSNKNTDGVQIETGNAYEGYFQNNVDIQNGKIHIAAGSINYPLTSNKVFAIIHFEAHDNITSTQFLIDFISPGNSYDSNIASTNTSTDLLSSVTNGFYTFVSEDCNQEVSDLVPPIISIINTSENHIQFQLSDDGSGIDINTLFISIDDVAYDISSSEISYIQEGDDYLVTFTPPNAFSSSELSKLYIGIRDNSDNLASLNMLFQINKTDVNTQVPSIMDILTQKNDIFKGTIFEYTIIEQIVNDIGISGVAALITGFILLLNILPLLTILNAPGILIKILSFWLGKHVNNPWGLVLDETVHTPIPFAICRLYISGTLTIVGQTVTDKEGRYSFSVGTGDYRLEIKHSNYQDFSIDVRITDTNQGYVNDVYLRSHNLGTKVYSDNLLHKVWISIKSIIDYIMPILFVLGFILAIFSILVTPTLLNYIILALYFLTGTLLILIKVLKRNKLAAVVDSTNNLRIPYVQIRIYQLPEFKLIDTITTNDQGKFDFWGQPGEYALLASLRGYKFPSSVHKQEELINTENSVMLKVSLRKGNNSIQIYMHPMENGYDVSNLATPFG